MSFTEQMEWGTTHAVAQQFEQLALLVSMLFMPLGLLALAQVTRWHAPRLTAAAVPLVLWGMWGFHNIRAMGYVSGVVGPTVLPLAQAIDVNDELPTASGVVATALVPHLVGTFFGLIVLTFAAWRCRQFARTACALLIAFFVWDFLLPSYGPLESHLLLTAAWTWMGLTIIRMGDRQWRAEPAAGVRCAQQPRRRVSILRPCRRSRPRTGRSPPHSPGRSERLPCSGRSWLMLTMYDDDANILAAMKAGAMSYLLKGSGPEPILSAVRAVGDGHAVFGAAVPGRMLDAFAAPRPRVGEAFPELSAREGEVLGYLANGLSNQQIAAELFISVITVRNHVSSILTKLQVSNRREAMLRARGAPALPE